MLRRVSLAFLCLSHHSLYDSRTSQHKNYTLGELRKARDDLFRVINEGRHLATPALRSGGRNADRKTLQNIISKLQDTIFFLRDWSFNGTSYPFFKLESIPDFLSVCREPVYEFVDGELEVARKVLIERLGKLNLLLDNGCRSVPGQNSWYRIPIEIEETDSQKYASIAARLDSASRKVCEAYDSLVRTVRRRLES